MAYSTTRQHPRFALRLPVLCEVRTAPGTWGIGITRNVSQGGLLLESPQPLAPGTRARLLLITGEYNARAKAEVVWTAAGPPCHMGLRFTTLTGVDQATWERLLAFQAGPTPRASIRIPVAVNVTCLLPPDLRLPGRVEELSEGGLGLSLHQSLPPQTRLRVMLPQWSASAPVAAEVKWSRAHPPTGGVLHGLQFLADDLSKEFFIIGVLLCELLGRENTSPSHQTREEENGTFGPTGGVPC